MICGRGIQVFFYLLKNAYKTGILNLIGTSNYLKVKFYLLFLA